jgi:choline dehydrogenase
VKRKIGYNHLLLTRPRQAVQGAKYLVDRRSPVGTPAYEMLSFHAVAPDATRPDAQVLLTPLTRGLAPAGFSVENRPGLSMLGFVLRPTSQGSTHITSADPDADVRLDPNYLATDHDREISVAMFKRMRAMAEQSPLAEDVVMEIQPGKAISSDEEILNAAWAYGSTGFHASGACAMGPDASDVVDARGRVRGTEGLRVMDVSMLPVMVSGNLNAPIMAMAWRLAEMMHAER